MSKNIFEKILEELKQHIAKYYAGIIGIALSIVFYN